MVMSCVVYGDVMCSFVLCIQLSDEELAQLQSSSWENPVFENMDQLMDERYPHTNNRISIHHHWCHTMFQ